MLFVKHTKASLFVAYNHVSASDVSHVIRTLVTRPALIFFHVKAASLNSLLSPLCGPPFMLVTEPRLLTLGLNLISVLIWSNRLSYGRR